LSRPLGPIWFWIFVELVHRGKQAVVNRAFHRLSRPSDGFFDCWPLFFKKAPEDVIDRPFLRRSPDPDPQPGDFFRSELDDDGFQAVMTGGASIGTQPQAAQRQGHVIKDHEHLRRLDLIKVGHPLEGFAAAVHITRRLDQDAFRPFGHERAPAL